MVDENGEPLIGVTVQVIGQKGGAITDIDGNFSVNAAPGAKLKFSYIGYADQTVAATASPMNVKLQPDNKQLQEVVVVGYGTQKKESLTGAVTVIDSKAFEQKGGLESPLQALQGQVPGVMMRADPAAAPHSPARGRIWRARRYRRRGLQQCQRLATHQLR